MFDEAAADLAGPLPGGGPLAARLAAWDERFTIPVDRVRGVVDALLPVFRRRSEALFGLPPGEGLTVSLVRDQPWSGYNWYDGGLRSRVDLNTDLPIRAADLLSVLPHETYPGHHLEHAWHEAHLVDGLGRMEASVLAIKRRPECLLSGGPRRSRQRFAVPPDEEGRPPDDVYRLAGLPVAGDPPAAPRDGRPPDRHLAGALAASAAWPGIAALMLHADEAPREEVLCLPWNGGSSRRRSAPPSASSSSPIPCGGRTSSSTSKGSDSCGAGSSWCRRRSRRPASGGC